MTVSRLISINKPFSWPVFYLTHVSSYKHPNVRIRKSLFTIFNCQDLSLGLALSWPYSQNVTLFFECLHLIRIILLAMWLDKKSYELARWFLRSVKKSKTCHAGYANWWIGWQGCMKTLADPPLYSWSNFTAQGLLWNECRWHVREISILCKNFNCCWSLNIYHSETFWAAGETEQNGLRIKRRKD